MPQKLQPPEMLLMGTRAVPCAARTTSLPGLGGMAGPRHRARPGSQRQARYQITFPSLFLPTEMQNWMLTGVLSPSVPTLAPVICRESSARRASAPSPVPGRAVPSAVAGLGNSRSSAPTAATSSRTRGCRGLCKRRRGKARRLRRAVSSEQGREKTLRGRVWPNSSRPNAWLFRRHIGTCPRDGESS